MTHIHVNLSQAHHAFVSYITAAYQQRIDPAVLDDVYQEKVARFTQYMDVLIQCALAGMEEQLAPLLNTLLQDWAIKEAVELLLRYQGQIIDPAHPGLQKRFWEKLERQHQSLSSELFLHLHRGKEQRVRTEEERAHNWQSVAYRSLEDQRQQQQQWHTAAMQWVDDHHHQNQQWFQHERDMFMQYQQSNKEWAHVAMAGVQQAQQGVKHWYDFAASTQQTVANWMAGTEQRQAALVEQTVQKATMKKWKTRFTIMSLVIFGIVALFGCAFFGLMHLY